MKNIAKKIRPFFLLMLICLTSGCYGYGAYMGLHGNSIRLHPDVHDGIIKDSQCLGCHHPNAPEGPPTPHPTFSGCIKCHNDEL